MKMDICTRGCPDSWSLDWKNQFRVPSNLVPEKELRFQFIKDSLIECVKILHELKSIARRVVCDGDASNVSAYTKLLSYYNDNSLLQLIFSWSIVTNCKQPFNSSFYLGDGAKSGEKKADFLRDLEDWIESWDKLKKSNEEKFTLSSQTSHALRHTLWCHASLIEDLLQEGYHFVTTTKFQRDSYLSNGCFTVSHRNVVCVVRKNPQAQNLKLEFDDTFKTNNSFSQKANDLLPLLERTVDLHSVRLYTKSRDVSDHIAGYVAFKAAKYCKDCCYNCLESFASGPTHGHSYVKLLSRDGLKHPSNKSDCVARGFEILDASSATILKSTPSSRKAGQITLTSYLYWEILFWKGTNVWLEKWLA